MKNSDCDYSMQEDVNCDECKYRLWCPYQK